MNEAERLVAGDPTLFVGSTASGALGWLHHPDAYGGPWLTATASRLPRRHDRALLVGMGGSSSPARMLSRTASLSVLDTSNPDTIAATDFSGATLIVASKSGTTIEVQTLMAHALVNGVEPEDLVVITDPGTPLAALGEWLEATMVLADPETGGRFSALSPFGLVPALYGGWSLDELAELQEANRLGADVVERARARAAAVEIAGGVGHVDVGGDPAVDGTALWLEQLVAETTGKDGRGIVPVSGPGPGPGPSQIMELHLAAAWLARRLGVDPFNQPDVERAKRDVFERLTPEARARTAPVAGLASLEVVLRHPGYRTVQVYGPLSAGALLAPLRAAIQARYGLTTANLGPRYLHSTGQLHKGGPAVGVVQVVVRPTSAPRRIQGRGYTFHDLHQAQADADLAALVGAGRAVTRIIVDTLDEVIAQVAALA
ncbi:MAG: hypothetical protein ACP5OV_04820 [Acidimicrobiales bacterium]